MVSYVCEHNWNLFSTHPLNVSVLFWILIVRTLKPTFFQ